MINPTVVDHIENNKLIALKQAEAGNTHSQNILDSHVDALSPEDREKFNGLVDDLWQKLDAGGDESQLAVQYVSNILNRRGITNAIQMQELKMAAPVGAA